MENHLNAVLHTWQPGKHNTPAKAVASVPPPARTAAVGNANANTDIRATMAIRAIPANAASDAATLSAPGEDSASNGLTTPKAVIQAITAVDEVRLPGILAKDAPNTGYAVLGEELSPLTKSDTEHAGPDHAVTVATANSALPGVIVDSDLPEEPKDASTAPTSTPARALKQAPPNGMPVATWAAQALGFQADTIQTEILNTHTPRLILCCTRQWGKSSVAAIKALHLAAAKPGAFILIASASYKQAAELLRVIRRHAERLIGARCKGDGINRGAIVLPNESRILAIPNSPDTVRCFAAVDVVIIDEAAFVETEMHNALSPMLATTNGQLWLLSSANNTTGEFYKIWRGNGPEWRRFKVTAPECSRISPEFLAAERAAKGEAVFNREYLCDFTAITAVGVPEDVVEDAFRGDVPAVTLPKQ